MTTRTRIDAMPDVPTVAESGYPGYESEVWFGLFAPSGMTRETVSRLGEWFSAAVRAPRHCTILCDFVACRWRMPHQAAESRTLNLLPVAWA
jgi:hypothetical protein